MKNRESQVIKQTLTDATSLEKPQTEAETTECLAGKHKAVVRR